MSWVFSLCTHLMLMLTNLFTVSTSVSSICCPLFSQHGCPEKLHIHVQLADLNTNNTYCSYSSILPCAPSGSSTARQFLFIPLLAFLLQLSTAAKKLLSVKVCFFESPEHLSVFSKATSCSLFLLFYWAFSTTHPQLLQTTGCSHTYLLWQTYLKGRLLMSMTHLDFFFPILRKLCDQLW